MTVSRDDVLRANAATHDAFAVRHEAACSYIARAYPRRFYQRLLATILQRHRLGVAGRHVVELGCGTGHHAGFLLDQGAADYVGVDVSPGMVGWAARRWTGRPGISFVVEDVEGYLRRHPESVDLAVSFSFLHHLHDLGAFFAALGGALAPNGLYVALHEPYRPRWAGRRLPSGYELDLELSALEDLDDVHRPLGARLRRFAGWLGRRTLRAAKDGVKTALGRDDALLADFVPAERRAAPRTPDVVDYQLNFDFTPFRLCGMAPAGLTLDVMTYSYYVHPLVAGLFGEVHNYFGLIASKTAPAITS